MGRGLRAELMGVLPEEMLEKVPRSFDIIGSKQKAVAIVEFAEELEEYESIVAEAIMKLHKNVASVLAKESARIGEYRTRGLRLVAGDPDTEVLHKESGCLFRLDPKTVYFSPRESSERERIAASVKDGERVLVMFSGIGPFPVYIARRHRNATVTAVELNPRAHNYCVENIHLNGVGDRVEAMLGDVRVVCRDLDKTYDRVLMPLPKGAYMYLDIAVPLLKDGGILHFYHWAPEDDLFREAEELLTQAAMEAGRSLEILKKVKVSQYSPRLWKIRIDAMILNQ